jgi:hypothetical protein
MIENLERQRAAFLKAHGAPMTSAQNAHAVATMLALQSMYFEDSESAARPEINCASFYASIAPNSSIDHHVLCDSLASAASARRRVAGSAADCSRSAAFAEISEIGYSIGCAPTAEVALICDELCAIQTSLAGAGLPPQFVFVFNAAWLLLDHLWHGAARDALGDDSVMEVRASLAHRACIVTLFRPI